jgi:hypothetical protein
VLERGPADLVEVVLALHAPSGFAGRLHRRQHERHENADDCDDHQQFDERKTV